MGRAFPPRLRDERDLRPCVGGLARNTVQPDAEIGTQRARPPRRKARRPKRGTWCLHRGRRGGTSSGPLRVYFVNASHTSLRVGNEGTACLSRLIGTSP